MGHIRYFTFFLSQLQVYSENTFDVMILCSVPAILYECYAWTNDPIFSVLRNGESLKLMSEVVV